MGGQDTGHVDRFSRGLKGDGREEKGRNGSYGQWTGS